MGNAKLGGPERAIRWTTTLSVIALAAIAAIVSYKHMYVLVRRYGEASWTAALVDGMIVASSMSLLLDSRCGRRSGFLPWALLVIGSAASLAANVAVAEPSAVGRLIAGWPSCALIGSYELLIRQIRLRACNRRCLKAPARVRLRRSLRQPSRSLRTLRWGPRTNLLPARRSRTSFIRMVGLTSRARQAGRGVIPQIRSGALTFPRGQ